MHYCCAAPWPQPKDFRNCILRLTYEADDSEFHVKVLWALQNPFVCAFLDLDLADDAEFEAGVMASGVAEEWRHKFVARPMAYSFSDGSEYDGDIVVEVLSDVTFLTGGMLAADSDYIGFDEFLALLPERPSATPRDAKPRRRLPPSSQLDPEVLRQHPWLLDVLPQREGGRRTGAASSSNAPPEQSALDKNDSAESDSDMSDKDGEEPFDVDAVVEALEKKRQEEAPKSKVAEVHFCWKVMGGKWCMENRGVPYDAFRATCASPSARQMLYMYRLNLSCSFTLSKYGEELARTLADYWVAKMTHFFNIWDSHGQTKHIFTDAELNRFAEPAPFAAAFATAEPALRQRMLELRALVPAAPR